MSLVKSYVELNKMADELVEAIRIINENYLKNDIEYPYGDVYKLVDKYDILFRKTLKRRYSFVNKFLSKVSTKKRVMLEGFSAPNKYDILNMSSEKVIPQILEVFDENKLTEDSMNEIKDKLFPVVKSLNLRTLIDLYKKCKKCEKILHSGNALAYLQEIFVEFTISNILHDPARKGVRSGVVWTYREICNNFLDEDVLRIRNSGRNR